MSIGVDDIRLEGVGAFNQVKLYIIFSQLVDYLEVKRPPMVF